MGHTGEAKLPRIIERIPTDYVTVPYHLTPQQIAALTSLDGFRLICRPPVFEVPADDVVLFQVGSSIAALSTHWQDVFNQHGIALTHDAKYEQATSSVVNPLRQTVTTFGEDDKPVWNWDIQNARRYAISAKDDMITVSQRQEYRTILDDRIVEGLPEDQLNDGRVVAIFLTIPDRKNPTQTLVKSDYTLKATHLGDVFLSDRVIKLRVLRTLQEMLPERYFFIQEGENPVNEFITREKVQEIEGDPDGLAIQGLPIAGTIILRLIAQGSLEFDNVTLRVLYKYYTSRLAASTAPTGGTGSAIV